MNGNANIYENSSNCISQDVMLKYINGELTGREMNQVERHLEVCHMCSDELEGLQNLRKSSDIVKITRMINRRIDGKVFPERAQVIKLNYIVRIAAILLIFLGISTFVYYYSFKNKPQLALSEDINIEQSREAATGLIEEKVFEANEAKPTEEEQDAEKILKKEEIAGEGLAIPESKLAERSVAAAQVISADEVVTDSMDTVDEDVDLADDITLAKGQVVAPAAVNSSTVAVVEKAEAKETQVEQAAFEAAGGVSARQSKQLISKTTASTDTEKVSDQNSNETLILAEEEVVEDQVFMVAEQMPEFTDQDGDDFSVYIMKNRRYPPTAIENGIQGKVYVEFCVEPDGSVSNVKVVQGVDPLLDSEAIRIVESSPKWKPGIQRGKPVKVKMAFPISFDLY